MAIIDPICWTDDDGPAIFPGNGGRGTEPGADLQEIVMSIRGTILAAAFTSALAGSAHAEEPRSAAGRGIDLGEVSGVAYYTVERDGFRVVATLAQGEAGTPVRFEAVLAPGQSVVLSSARGAGAAPDAVEISRRDDRVLVREAPPVTN
jgi:hypothetical protein